MADEKEVKNPNDEMSILQDLEERCDKINNIKNKPEYFALLTEEEKTEEVCLNLITNDHTYYQLINPKFQEDISFVYSAFARNPKICMFVKKELLSPEMMEYYKNEKKKEYDTKITKQWIKALTYCPNLIDHAPKEMQTTEMVAELIAADPMIYITKISKHATYEAAVLAYKISGNLNIFIGCTMTGKEFNELIENKTWIIKLTTYDECHNGFQFYTGYNSIKEKFQNWDHCSPGGLYACEWSKRYRWIEYADKKMCWFRNVTYPDDAMIYIENDKIKCDKFILGERSKLNY
jgi:hypothetical protein